MQDILKLAHGSNPNLLFFFRNEKNFGIYAYWHTNTCPLLDPFLLGMIPLYSYVGVSKNNGTPKSSIKTSILEGKHHPYFWKHPYALSILLYSDICKVLWIHIKPSSLQNYEGATQKCPTKKT